MQHTAQPMAFPPSESDDTDSGHCMVLESIDPNSISVYRRHTKLFAAPASSKGLSQREFRCLALNVHRVWNVEQAIVSTLAKAKGLKVASYSTAATVLSWLLQVLAQDSEFGSQRLWGDGSPIQVDYEVTGRIADSSLTVAPRGFTAARLPSPSLWVWVSQMLGLTPVAPSRCIAADQLTAGPVEFLSFDSREDQTGTQNSGKQVFYLHCREPLTLFSHIEINEYSIFKGTSNVIGSNTAEYHCNYESPEVMAQCQYLSSSIVQTDVDHPLERHPALELPDHFDN
ncbi:hypothetical protein BDP67DRAFT_613268 [Colletotrichum lupini]|nr:hypothetical protein BDP67DRAFT_613268 [Colletotrichum lupini]